MEALRKLISVDFEVFGKVQGLDSIHVLTRRRLVPQIHPGAGDETLVGWLVHEHSSRNCSRSVGNVKWK